MSLFSLFSRFGLLQAVIAVAAIGVGTTAFAGQNTFSAANNAAGQNSQVVSGYTVSAPTYTLDATTPTNIDSVSFTATGAVIPTTAKLKLSAAYKTCTVTGSASPWTITCNNGSTLGETVSGATTFDVLLVQ